MHSVADCILLHKPKKMKRILCIVHIILFSVFLLTTNQLRAEEWSGTGFALKAGYVVTNYRIVEGASTILVKGVQGNFQIGYKAKVVATDKINDIAIIKITDQRFQGVGTIPYTVTKFMPDLGAYVWTLGYPLTEAKGNEIKFTDGNVYSHNGFNGELRLYQISIPLQLGNGGGPLFDGDGNITGIISSSGSYENSQDLNDAIKASYLYNLVEKELSTSIFPQGRMMRGQPLTQKINLAKKFVYMVVCSNNGGGSSTGSMPAYMHLAPRHNFVESAFETNMQMIWVEGGSFMMGCTSEQGEDCDEDEKNVHRVTLDGFYIGMLEVTQSQWEKVMGTTLSQHKTKSGNSYTYGVGPDYPMYYVSWDEAMAFCRKLSRQTGRKYTLPTEAQWEYAARGGVKSERTKYAGSNVADVVAWYESNSENSTHRCGTKRANVLGIYDMSGNVWEWCHDWYSDTYVYSTNNPSGPSSGFERVLRGGGWSINANYCRVASRYDQLPDDRGNIIGFRVVCLP